MTRSNILTFLAQATMSVVVAGIVANVIHLILPQGDTMCSGISRVDCLRDFVLNWESLFILILISSIATLPSLALSKLWSTQTEISDVITIGILGGVLTYAEFFAGALQNLDIKISDDFGIFATMLGYALLIFCPFFLSVLLAKFRRHFLSS